jgi:NADH-quinone oxidoreductase subunit L
MDEHTRSHVHESPAVVWVPLVLLAIPSVIAGALFMGPLLSGVYAKSIFVLPEHDALKHIAEEYHGFVAMGLHGLTSVPFMLGLAGIFAAWLAYLQIPGLARGISKALAPLYLALIHKYGFDGFNQKVLVRATRGLGWLFWRVGDATLIDGVAVDGSANSIGYFSRVMRHLQSGYVYHYAFAMITGLIVFLAWLMWR